MTLDQAVEQLRTSAETEVRKSAEQTADTLHQLLRRIRQASSESEVCGLLVKTPQEGHSLCITFDGERARAADKSFAPSEAPALMNAIETKDTVVAFASSGELSETLFHELDTEGRVHLMPVVVHGAVQMVLVATDLSHTAIMETLCEAAGLRLEALSLEEAVRTEPEPEPPVLVQIAGMKAGSQPKWEELSAPEQSRHLRAQHFAQVAVARMRVEQIAAVRAGQGSGDLYRALRGSIDKARSDYREQFLSGESKTMVDYLYMELVRSLANGEDRLLGPDFPGRLI